MIEVYPNLYVGSEQDETSLRGQPGWYFIHACKEPYHRQALGYSGRAVAKSHPEYLIAKRQGRLILNLVDANDPNYIPADIIDAALIAIKDNIQHSKILLHCNQGHSRSPGIAFLFLLRHTTILEKTDISSALSSFRSIYPNFNPARGIAEYIHINWHLYVQENLPPMQPIEEQGEP